MISQKQKQVLLLDRIQDPGNLGTLIRTADAAGIDMIVMEKGTADAYQDKVMRASQGSVFHIPIVTTELNKFIEQFDGPVYGTALENAVSYKNIESQDTFALLLGNEGEGVNKRIISTYLAESYYTYIRQSGKFKRGDCWKYFALSFERLTF